MTFRSLEHLELPTKPEIFHAIVPAKAGWNATLGEHPKDGPEGGEQSESPSDLQITKITRLQLSTGRQKFC